MPIRRRSPKSRGGSEWLTAELLLGKLCHKDGHPSGPWCPCSRYASPAEREAAYWRLPADVRRTTFAHLEYDPDARAAREHAMDNDLDLVLVQIERGLLTREELAHIVAHSRRPTGEYHESGAERAEAAREALASDRFAEP